MNKAVISFYSGMWLVVFSLWVLLTGSLAVDELLMGAVVAAGVALATPRSPLFSGFVINAATPLSLLRYLVHFIVALIKANLDMARRVLTPALPLNPAVVEIQTKLESRLGRLLLANSITLTPGTLTVDVKDQRLIVHWVDCAPGEDLESATRAIASGFERHIRGFLK